MDQVQGDIGRGSFFFYEEALSWGEKNPAKLAVSLHSQ